MPVRVKCFLGEAGQQQISVSGKNFAKSLRKMGVARIFLG
jgi:hypothetical protein